MPAVGRPVFLADLHPSLLRYVGVNDEASDPSPSDSSLDDPDPDPDRRARDRGSRPPLTTTPLPARE